MNLKGQQVSKARLYWQCRRGMRELDLLLEAFMGSQYDGLSVQEQEVFNTLLTYPDHLLLEYLMGRIVPSDKEIACVVAKICNTPTH